MVQIWPIKKVSHVYALEEELTDYGLFSKPKQLAAAARIKWNYAICSKIIIIIIIISNWTKLFPLLLVCS